MPLRLGSSVVPKAIPIRSPAFAVKMWRIDLTTTTGDKWISLGTVAWILAYQVISNSFVASGNSAWLNTLSELHPKPPMASFWNVYRLSSPYVKEICLLPLTMLSNKLELRAKIFFFIVL
ncbi:uncharacterized protein [Dermacentor andersoni]|uniref:uncharacterized protein n=1 Tax=Dermacentor andersoni TaxID=34620 RepID=UPI00241724C8|nr:uncharacterized protein LOC129383807 [Dermacentor andersoni]